MAAQADLSLSLRFTGYHRLTATQQLDLTHRVAARMREVVEDELAAILTVHGGPEQEG